MEEDGSECCPGTGEKGRGIKMGSDGCEEFSLGTTSLLTSLERDLSFQGIEKVLEVFVK